ncbi:von Willebrand factor type A metal sensing stress response protein [Oleiphilus messinensis]|uniref:von Willebrand factor type A metal sensing stress response protein n=1 Tax=Oleiphilus messinensis TaxID=141451 RepID=A0A1Y0I9I8_9GAMM|nr:VWA domain-containing protein [Oleiphilus messinensis]ARU56426.1 von Willebrand factor type A metal sensing stress response protein [Oleiphilus messinensis]
MISLNKNQIIDLSKLAAKELADKNLSGVNANVAVVLDVSKSMHPLYKDGTVQNTLDRLLALAMKIDDDQQIDAYVFGTTACALNPLTLDDVEGYVEREIVAKHKINQATKYATAIELIQKQYFGQKKPTFVIFITDGDNSDKAETKRWLVQICREPIFWQFVGIGKEEFKFLTRLDDLPGRAIDNAGFMHVNDLTQISDSELYSRLLGEFPQWHEEIQRRVLKQRPDSV